MANTAITYSYDVAMRLLAFTKFGSILGIDTLDPVQEEAINKGVVICPKRIAQRMIAEKRGETFLEFINVYPVRFQFSWERNRSVVSRSGLRFQKSDGTLGTIRAHPIDIEYHMWFWSNSLDRVRLCMEQYIQWQHTAPKIDLIFDSEFSYNPDLIFSPVVDESEIEDLYNNGKVWVYRMSARLEGWLPEYNDLNTARIEKIRLTAYDTTQGKTNYVEIAVETDANHDADLAAAIKMFRANLYGIVGVDHTSNSLTVSKDRTADFTATAKFKVENSTKNNETYTVATSSYSGVNDETTIITVEDLVDSTVDGNIYLHEGVN
jgi:hypothetical protein